MWALVLSPKMSSISTIGINDTGTAMGGFYPRASRVHPHQKFITLRKVFLSLICLCAQANTEPRNHKEPEQDVLLQQGVPLAAWRPNVGILLAVPNLTETSMWQLSLSTKEGAQEKVTGSFEK